MKTKRLALLLLSLSALSGMNAQVTLPSVFGDNMVLQQKSEVPVWGWGIASETVRLVGSWAPQDTVKAVAAPDGKWMATMKTTAAGGPYTLTILGSSKQELQNVMLGEVWLCSGQSNMEWTPLLGIQDHEKEIKEASYPDLRLFQVKKKGSAYPQDNCEAQWKTCTPQSMSQSSAVAYFFGRRLQEILKVPVGLMISAWGGTPAEVWVKEDLIKENKELEANKPTKTYPWWPVESGVLYNQMIHPLIPYRIAGSIWYQGESNQDRYKTYDAVMKELIGSWRKDFGHEFPFYFVQIAPHTYGAKDNGPALLREQQEKTSIEMPKTGMVVISDLVNDVKNIHPLNKQDVGLRLANMALANDYGQDSKGVFSPTFESMKVDKGKAIVSFRHVDGGLMCKDKKIIGLKVAAEDGAWVDGTGKIEGSTLVVTASKVKNPVKVAYCFDDATIGNLFSEEGLPVAPFRSDRGF